MIVVEGPDGAGKSTLLENLVVSLEVTPMPRACTSKDGPVNELQEWTSENIAQVLAQPHQLHLIDRHPLISEPIYGPLVRGSLAEGFETSWYIGAWQTWLMCRPTLIICLPPEEVVRENVLKSDDGQMEGVTMNIRAIYWLYNNLAARLKAYGQPTVYLWDYTSPEADDVYAVITSQLTIERVRRKNSGFY